MAVKLVTPRQRSWAIWQRVVFKHPGKHGDKDLRVEFGGLAPSLAEALAILWGMFWSEDRYDAPGQRGRAMLKALVDEIYECRRWEDAKEIVERAASSVEQKRAA